MVLIGKIYKIENVLIENVQVFSNNFGDHWWTIRFCTKLRMVHEIVAENTIFYRKNYKKARPDSINELQPTWVYILI